MLDYILIAVILYHIFKGFRRGLVRIIFDLLGILVSLGAAYRVYPFCADRLLFYLPDFPPQYLNPTGFLLVLGGVFMVMRGITLILNKVVNLTGLSLFNRLLGAGTGAIKGGLYTVPILAILLVTHPEKVRESWLFERLVPVISQLLKSDTETHP